MVTLASPSVQSTPRRGAHDPAEALLTRYADGRIAALSLTQPGVVYLLTLAPVSCTCPGFTHRGRCYHSAAAAARYAEQAEERRYVCYSCGAPWDAETGTIRGGFH